MLVRVHRWPVKVAHAVGRYVRTAKPCETKMLEAKCIFGHGIDVYFPLNDVRTFNKYDGAGRGRMRDWQIDPEDHRNLLKEEQKS